MSETEVMMLARSSKRGSKHRRMLGGKGQVAEQAIKSLTKSLCLIKFYEQLGDKEGASKPKNLDYSKEKVPLLFSKELLNELKSEATRALKMQSCDRLTDPYDHLERFIYVGYS
ncbi:hypothetical protein DVH24_023402 [Malus domestica]|uniref:Uncharacterized protein n=1 Tax=Malus domestica TaxID=3750 RepID=A0A498HZV0_MALDO|nr:hypothetical protein DVH24_023402 [Malus domestica]